MLDFDALARLKRLATHHVAASGYPPGTYAVRVQPGNDGRASVQVTTRCEGRGRSITFGVPLGDPGRYDDLVVETIDRWLSGE